MIASPGSFHEFLLHVALGGGAAHLTTLTEYGEATYAERSNFGAAPIRRDTISLPTIRTDATESAAREDPGS